MENILEEDQIVKNNNQNIIEEKTDLQNQKEINTIINSEIKETDLKTEVEGESQNNKNIDKNQILQDKLKKIVIGRETNKFKYNKVNIPDDLKYSSDNSNSSSPKKPEKNLSRDIKKDVNKQENDKKEENKNDNNNLINNNKEIITKNLNENNIETNIQKDIKSDIIIKDDLNKDLNKKELENMNNNKDKNINKKNIEKEKVEENNVNKVIDSNNNENKIIYQKNIIKNDENNNNKNNDNDISNNDNNNSIIEHNQSCKNYVIKKIPERKKNKNKNNEEERNKSYTMGFINSRKRNNKSINNNIINQNETEKKEIEDINNNNNNNNIINSDKKIDNEVEKNKSLYRQLMAKKLGSNKNILHNSINQPSNQNELENKKINQETVESPQRPSSSKILKTPKKRTNTEKDEYLKDKNKNEENKNNNNFDIGNELSEFKNKTSRGTAKITGTSKEKTAKEGALKILELIKAKKNEKNVIEQKKKETQEIIKKTKSSQAEITESNSTIITKEEDIFSQSTNRTVPLKEKEKNKNNINIKETENKINIKEQKEGKKEKENAKKQIPKQVYKRYKGKASLSGNNNLKNIIENQNQKQNPSKGIKTSSHKNVKFNFESEIENNNKNNNNNDNNYKEFIKNELQNDTMSAHKKINSNIKLNINAFVSNNSYGYKTENEDLNETEKKRNNYFKNKTSKQEEKIDNNLALNLEEKIRRQKLEKDLAAEINKEDSSSYRELKEKNNNNNINVHKSKYIINRNNTSISFNKPYTNKKPKVSISKQKNEQYNHTLNNLIQTKTDNNNLNDYNLLQNNQNDIIYNSNNQTINENNNFNFYANSTQKKYEQKKTYQNQNNNINMNLNINLTTQSPNKLNNLYAPKKCFMLNKASTIINEKQESPFINKSNSPEINIFKNMNNKKYKSPKEFNLFNDKLYVRKNLANASSKKDNNNNKLNNSLGTIRPSLDNNYDINKIIKNKGNTEIGAIEVKNNLNSSFQYKMDLERKNFNRGNIFNQIFDEEDNNTNKYANLNSSYGGRFFQDNLPRIQKVNNIDDGFNTFYINNNNKSSNYFNKNSNKNSLYKNNNYNNNNFNSNNIYGRMNINNNNNIKKINSIYNYKSENKNSFKKRYEKNNNYITNSNKYLISINDLLKYEDLLILEDKLIYIMISLNHDKLIYNECFDYWNFFFNSSFYENIDQIFSNYDSENKNLIKICINSNLMSILLCYDTSFDIERLNKIRPLLLEMLELCHKLLIEIYEFVLNMTKKNYNNNIWVKKINHLINSSKLSEGDETVFIDSSNISEKEKMKYNINFLKQKIYYILSNYPSQSSQNYLMSLFKKLNEKTYEDINDFFLEYILREKDIKYSVLASTFLKSGEIISPLPFPYLNYTSPKNYTLVLDIDETLFHFKINEDDEEQGVLKIRPGVFQFIDEIKEYYEIILFSEADKNYIDLITDAVGENRYLYDYVLCREYITIVGQNFIKDLSKIGRPLDKIIIIDNMPQNFSYNKENGIYIKPFWGEENDDKALIDLIPILINIARSGRDVRKELVRYKEKIVTKISSNLYKHNNL